MIALLQPIEIHAGNRQFTIEVGALGPAVITLGLGTYACVLTLLREIQSHLDAAAIPARVHLETGDHEGFVAFSAWGLVGDIEVTFDHPPLARLLGWRTLTFVAPLPATVIADDHPQRSFFPGIVASERHRWHRDLDRAFAGTQAQDGTCSGVEQGPPVYRRRLVWDDIRSRAALEEGCVDSYSMAGATYYPQQERAWESFVQSARASTLVDPTQAGVTGCFYVPCVQDFCTSAPFVGPYEYPSDMGTGGIRHSLAVDPDAWCFAHLDANAPPSATESLDGSVEYYRVEVDLITAPIPARGWTVPTAAPATAPILTHSDVVPRTTTISLRVPPGVSNAVAIYWGDGAVTHVVCDNVTNTYTHDYAAGTFHISLQGNYDQITQWISHSQSWLSGDLEDFAALSALMILRLYTTGVSGDIAHLAGMDLTTLFLFNTGCYGDIAHLAGMPLGILRIYNTGCTYPVGGMVQPMAWKTADIQCYDCGWTTAMVDQMLIDHDAIDVAGYASNLWIAGTNAGRTNPGAGENARASLVAKGKNVSVN